MHIYIVEFFSLCLLLSLKNVLETYNAYIYHMLSELRELRNHRSTLVKSVISYRYNR